MSFTESYEKKVQFKKAFGEFPSYTLSNTINARVDAIRTLEKLHFFVATTNEEEACQFMQEHNCKFLLRFMRSAEGFALHYKDTGEEEVIEKTRILLVPTGYVKLISARPEVFCTHIHPSVLHLLLHHEHQTFYTTQLQQRLHQQGSVVEYFAQ